MGRSGWSGVVGAALAAASVVGFVVAVGGWVGSHVRPVVPRGVDMRSEGENYVWEGVVVMSDRGVAGVGWEYLLEKTAGATDRHTEFETFFVQETQLPPEGGPRTGPPGWMGFNAFFDRGDDEIARWSAWWVACPWWFLTCLTLAYPAWWGRGWWRGRRSRRWVERRMCGVCGYDLRGSGGRCSECGEMRGDTIEASRAS
jgi:hypothetical protein